MELHRNSHDFHWQDPPGPFTLIGEDRARTYCARGGFVFDGAFAADEIEVLTAALDPLEESAERALAEAADAPAGVGSPGIARPGEIVFAAHLVARCEVARAFSRHPLLCQLVTELIGADVRLYWDQLVYKKPHTGADFPWHQDNGYTFVEPQQYLTCWIALTDASVTNGCPWIAPGLHRQGTLAHRWTDLGFRCFEEAPAAEPLELTAGSMAVFSSLTPHMTGPNRTNEVRKSYILQYAPDGAVMYPRGAPSVAAANPDWQYPVTRGGRPVALSEMHS